MTKGGDTVEVLYYGEMKMGKYQKDRRIWKLKRSCANIERESSKEFGGYGLGKG